MSGPIQFPIETERLLLRPAAPDDARELHELLSDPATFEYINSGPLASIADTRREIDRRVAQQEEHGFSLWVVVEKASERVVGECGLQLLEHTGPDVELGYTLIPRVRGRGLATEAGRACLIAGFDDLGLERIVAVADPANVASRRVMKKLGMTMMGLGHHYGGPSVLYAITKAEEAAAEERAG